MWGMRLGNDAHTSRWLYMCHTYCRLPANIFKSFPSRPPHTNGFCLYFRCRFYSWIEQHMAGRSWFDKHLALLACWLICWFLLDMQFPKALMDIYTEHLVVSFFALCSRFLLRTCEDDMKLPKVTMDISPGLLWHELFFRALLSLLLRTCEDDMILPKVTMEISPGLLWHVFKFPDLYFSS